RPITVRWSGCPASCGNHHTADIGLQGCKVRVDGKVVDGVHVFVGGRGGSDPRVGARIMEDMPCDELPQVLERLVRVFPRPEAPLRWRPREYTAGDAAGFILVMVATDDIAVNAIVAAECRERGAWVNGADDPARCDFILPSVCRRGAVTVAVSTGGASPTMARLVREEL